VSQLFNVHLYKAIARYFLISNITLLRLGILNDYSACRCSIGVAPILIFIMPLITGSVKGRVMKFLQGCSVDKNLLKNITNIKPAQHSEVTTARNRIRVVDRVSGQGGGVTQNDCSKSIITFRR